jgi:uncharacterized phosphosugar-binding protein
MDFGDIVIDNHVPIGDAVLDVNGISGKIVPSSTILSVLILNMIIAQIAEELLILGSTPKFYISGNIPGGAISNKRYIEEYKGRIKLL